MSPETLRLFADLLGQVQISGGDPDFDKIVSRISLARKELTRALDGPTEEPVRGG